MIRYLSDIMSVHLRIEDYYADCQMIYKLAIEMCQIVSIFLIPYAFVPALASSR